MHKMSLTDEQHKTLLNMGFVAVRYEADEGVFLRRDTTVGSMPYAGEHMVPDEASESDIMTTEVTPDGLVQAIVNDVGLEGESYRFGTEEADALLKDSAAGTKPTRMHGEGDGKWTFA